ncbi:enoyl-CoA hydratase [Mycobacterium sp. MYCO198283]|uniref:enoyl-CoA hydratase n=1 Tax=Mycobacterium sp. MYCO198283 TaxID=2883505 RepID=UPI001E5B1295|nr:enoyl-CoA hydratase [Mycobacterium sp. MYCO198283]MCG5430828.1 enoyl-CoA hydratase [Mycobacterium sp. MYCO198283]
MTTTQSAVDALPAVDGLSVAFADGVLTVTINRPESLNALTAGVLNGIADAMTAAAGDPRVKVVRLAGAGRGFSSGADISSDRGGADTVPMETLDAADRAARSIVAVPHPVVALVHGPAAGVGVSLALACDVVLASDKAFLLLAFTKIGLMPDGGASALVAAAIGRIRAMRMALLAERISATEALEWGLVSAVFPAEEFDAEADKVVAALAAGPAVALAKTKAAVNAATLTEFDAALRREYDGQSQLLQAADVREGMRAFQERRAPKFTDA